MHIIIAVFGVAAIGIFIAARLLSAIDRVNNARAEIENRKLQRVKSNR